MSGGRQTGTVPKTKHNSRVRRENPVNHIPNNLDWHESFPPQRVRKESNTNTRLSDTGEEGFMFEDNPWANPSNRTDDDELRWSNVKSSNITPERGNSSTNVDAYISNRSIRRQESSGAEEREMPAISKETIRHGRIKLKMEPPERKDEPQQSPATLLCWRNKTAQYMQHMDEMQQHTTFLGSRSKTIQQMKPVQIMQALDRDETTANLVDSSEIPSDLSIRMKIDQLIARKLQCDNILACMENENFSGVSGPGSIGSSDDVALAQLSRARTFIEAEEVSGRPDVNKQDNRELEHHSSGPSAAYIQNKELEFERLKIHLDELQTLLSGVVDSSPESKNPQLRMNGEAIQVEPSPTCQSCPRARVFKKLITKKNDLEQDIRKLKTSAQGFHYNRPGGLESWTNSVNGATANSVDYSSEDGDFEFDESPVKLCSTSSYLQPNSFPKPSAIGLQPVPKASPASGVAGGGGGKGGGGRGRESRRTLGQELRGRGRAPNIDAREVVTNKTTSLADQISELQNQMEEMQILYQGMLEKQVANFTSPQPWIPQPPNLGFMQFMAQPSPQWHQHQLLINSLNQCCQLIWHQQRELAGLRQALAMIQDESRMYKCGGYGNNLNFDPSGLLWPQSSPQTLNNQVPPGNRANNYWDNFRSYSRQNLLSGRNKSNEGSIAESLSTPRPSVQTDNLRRRKENHTLGNAQVNEPQLHSGEVSSTVNSSCRSRRRYNSNIKADATAVFSLEQSIYSELETVIAQTERSPQLLLQLLTQLKNIRSQRPSPYEDGNPMGFENELDLMEIGLPSYPNVPSRIDDPSRRTTTSHHVNYQQRKREKVLEDISRLLERQEAEIVTSTVIVKMIMYCKVLLLDDETESNLYVALDKFKGARLRQVADKILSTIDRILFNENSIPARSNDVEVEDCGIDEVEEGAVGGMPLAPPQQPKPSSVEAELAEADQTQCSSSDNVEIFGIDEDGLLNTEHLDNQELPPREENQEQLLQEP